MKPKPLQLTVHVAWWVRWYCFGVILFARMMGAEPDMEKVQRTLRRGFTIKVS